MPAAAGKPEHRCRPSRAASRRGCLRRQAHVPRRRRSWPAAGVRHQGRARSVAVAGGAGYRSSPTAPMARCSRSRAPAAKSTCMTARLALRAVSWERRRRSWRQLQRVAGHPQPARASGSPRHLRSAATGPTWRSPHSRGGWWSGRCAVTRRSLLAKRSRPARPCHLRRRVHVGRRDQSPSLPSTACRSTTLRAARCGGPCPGSARRPIGAEPKRSRTGRRVGGAEPRRRRSSVAVEHEDVASGRGSSLPSRRGR